MTMSIRLRLALVYGAVFAPILLMMGLLSYAFHARGHYEDLDRVLVASAAHTAATVPSMVDVHLTDHLAADVGTGVVVRLYDRDGKLQASSAPTEMIPAFDPRETLASPSGPA
ncbi:MAG: hypothetical protein WD535_01115 [Thermaerobacterales bacterium]